MWLLVRFFLHLCETVIIKCNMKTSDEKFIAGLKQLFTDAGANTPEEQIALITKGIPEAVEGFRRPWSNVDADIDSVMKGEVGVAVLMTYVENGERFVLLCQSGAHYFKDQPNEGEMPEKYSYPGGFANLVECEGSFFVNKKNVPEEPEQAGAREVEEEIVDDQGNPVIYVDPQRCKPLDHDIVSNKFGKPIVVCSMYYNLTPNEVGALKGHLEKLANSEEYRAKCAEFTKSPASGLPEVHTAKFVRVHDAAMKIPFLYDGQEEHIRRLIRHENDVLSKLSADTFSRYEK